MWCLHFQSCWLQRTRAPLLPLRPLYPSSAGAVRARTQPGPEEHLQSHARYPTQRALTSGARTGNSDNTAVGWCTARQEEGQGRTIWMSRLMSRWLLLFSFTVFNIRYLTWLDTWLIKKSNLTLTFIIRMAIHHLSSIKFIFIRRKWISLPHIKMSGSLTLVWP